jgi:hypothetical protein
MVRKKVVDYIRNLLQQGYNISTVKNVMSKYGYSNREIDQALEDISHASIRHEIHLSGTTLFAVIFMFLVIIGIIGFFYVNPPKGPSTLLDLNLEPVQTTVSPGENIIFVKELSNLGSTKRYDVVIKHEILHPSTYKSISPEKIETRAIETFGATRTMLKIPIDAETGDYILRTIVEYKKKKAIATLPIKIIDPGSPPTCEDGIKNQDEIDIDCGGVCKKCHDKLNCQDNNPCTNDILINGKCAYNDIIPCCGNDICENGEKGICSLDCVIIVERTPNEDIGSLDEIKNIARTDPVNALLKCNSIKVPSIKDTCISNIASAQNNQNYCTKITTIRIKDLCYSNIAKSKNDNKLCRDISTDGIRDSCYMTFVLDNDDYTVCLEIANEYLVQSCESLRQLHAINQKT